jgi:dTDP-4-dehydrorhamnose reductase
MTDAPAALVLGGHTGLLGQALMQALALSGRRAVALGRQDGDVTDVKFLTRVVRRVAPDVIFNAVAWTQVDEAEEKPDEALLLNRGLPAALAQVVRGSSVRLVQYSTDFVFNGGKSTPYTTEDEPAPESAYGAGKLAGEQALAALPPEQYCIIRTAWLFGPGRANFVDAVLDACRRREMVSVVHDQIGSPTYSRDLAHWSVKLVKIGAQGIFHAVNGGQASRCDLACEAVSLAGAPCRVRPIESPDWPQKAKRPAFSVLDTSRFTQVTGITPRPWPVALREYIFREYLPRLSGE